MFGLKDQHILEGKKFFDGPPHHDFSKLFKKAWLNDIVINDHIALQIKDKKDFCSLDSIIDLRKVKGLYPPLKINKLFGAKKMLFAPLHVNNNHWTLLAVDLTKRSLRYFDSLNNKAPLAKIDTIRQHLIKIAKEEQVTLSEKDFRLICEECPQQENGSDCGVFVLMAVDHLVQNKPLSYSGQDAPFMRLKVLSDLWQLF